MNCIHKLKNGIRFSSSAYIYSHIHITSPSIDLCTYFRFQGNYIIATPTCQAQFTCKFICLCVDLSICQANHRCQSYSTIPPSAHTAKTTNKQSSDPHLYTARQPIRYIKPHTHPYSTMLATTYTQHRALIYRYTAPSYIHLYHHPYMPIYIMSIYMYIHIAIVYIYIHIYPYCGEK